MNRKQFEDLLKKNEKKVLSSLKKIEASSAEFEKRFKDIMRAI